MNGFTIHISGQAVWFAFGFLTASAAWVWPENAEHFLHGLERGIAREREK